MLKGVGERKSSRPGGGRGFHLETNFGKQTPIFLEEKKRGTLGYTKKSLVKEKENKKRLPAVFKGVWETEKTENRGGA